MGRTTWRIWVWVSPAALAVAAGLLLYYGRPISCPASGSFGGADPGSIECDERVHTAMRMFWIGLLLAGGGLVGLGAAADLRRRGRQSAPSA